MTPHMILPYVFSFLWNIHFVIALTGHVCHVKRAENFLQSYNQAFLCQERYTTSCGHLDWRRCTKYRVQTCYTPQQKYSTRYHQEEQCCLGWREDEFGSCSIPVCTVLCLNGGTCTNANGGSSCICQEGYRGDRCQTEENEWRAWYTVILCGFVAVVIIFVALLVYCCKKHKYMLSPKSGFRRAGPIKVIQTRQLGIGSHTNNSTCSGIPLDHFTHGVYPSAPLDTLVESTC